MKYSLAIAALFAVCVLDGASAINLSEQPIAEKEAPKKDEEALKAKLAARGEEKKAQDEAAVKAETAAFNADETAKERNARYLKEVYVKNMDDMVNETKRIKKLRVRPADSKPMEGHDEAVNTETSTLEHWALNMPEHIINNEVGPTAKWNSPKPKELPAAAQAAVDVEKAAEAKEAAAA